MIENVWNRDSINGSMALVLWMLCSMALANSFDERVAGIYVSTSAEFDAKLLVYPVGPGEYEGTFLALGEAYEFVASRNGLTIEGAYDFDGRPSDLSFRAPSGDQITLNGTDFRFPMVRKPLPSPVGAFQGSYGTLIILERESNSLSALLRTSRGDEVSLSGRRMGAGADLGSGAYRLTFDLKQEQLYFESEDVFEVAKRIDINEAVRSETKRCQNSASATSLQATIACYDQLAAQFSGVSVVGDERVAAIKRYFSFTNQLFDEGQFEAANDLRTKLFAFTQNDPVFDSGLDGLQTKALKALVEEVESKLKAIEEAYKYKREGRSYSFLKWGWPEIQSISRYLKLSSSFDSGSDSQEREARIQGVQRLSLLLDKGADYYIQLEKLYRAEAEWRLSVDDENDEVQQHAKFLVKAHGFDPAWQSVLIDAPSSLPTFALNPLEVPPEEYLSGLEQWIADHGSAEYQPIRTAKSGTYAFVSLLVNERLIMLADVLWPEAYKRRAPANLVELREDLAVQLGEIRRLIEAFPRQPPYNLGRDEIEQANRVYSDSKDMIENFVREVDRYKPNKSKPRINTLNDIRDNLLIGDIEIEYEEHRALFEDRRKR